MSLIVGEGLGKSWSDKDVLRNVKFTLGPADRVGMVGPNGHGKTTLIRLIAGLEEPTAGRLQKANDLRIGYMPQDPPALAGSTLRQAMVDVFSDLIQIENELHELAHAMGGDCHDEKMLIRYGELQHRFETGGGYEYQRKIDQVLEGLAFGCDTWDRPLSELSGGQRTRAYLGSLLLREPDVLLLDEPTNHLDLCAVEWLEKWLENFAGSLIVVSHDRYFLDRVTRSTWELAFAEIECYKGSYSHYATQRNERFKERMRRYEAQQEFVAQTQEFIRRFIAGQRSKEAQGRRTRLERFLKTEAIQKPREVSRISVRFRVTQRAGDFVLHLAGLAAGYRADQPLVKIEKLDVQRGQRIAIVGPNGCGKTTLLRTMLGQLPPLAGSARWGGGVQLGYLSQTHAELRSDMTALQAVRELDTSMSEERGRAILGSLLLSGDDAFKKICELSGGQRSRVVLARLMLQKPNVLILDEPTNHLDILSQEVLQDVLGDYDGTILLVSHDRYLIQALASDIWAMHDGEVTPLAGSWEKYLQYRNQQMEIAGQTPPDQGELVKAKTRRVEDYKERRRKTNEINRLHRKLKNVEDEIHRLESHLKAINEKIGQAGEKGDVDGITALGQEYTQADQKLQALFGQWETISAELEEAGAE